MREAPWSRREGLALAGLMGLGLALRLVFVADMEANPHHRNPIMDSAVHVAWAKAIAAGEPFAPFADRPFFRAPLYVLFLAGVFAVFGDGLLAPRIVQCLLGTASVGLVHTVGRRAFGARAGLLAALLAATYWVLIYFDGELLIPTLAVFLDLLALWLTLAIARPGAPPARIAAAGFVWGLSALARPNVLLFLPCLAAWLLLLHRPRWARGIAAAAVFAAALLGPILPVTAYNTFAKGDFVLISSQGGVNFWIGNHPEARGVVAIVPGTRAGWWEGYWDAIAQAEQAEGRSLRASEVSRHYARRAWHFIWSRPERSLPLFAEKLRLFFTAWEYSNNEDIHFFAHRYSVVPALSIGFAVLAPLGLLGFALSLRDPRLFPLWGFLVVYTASVVVFFVNARFRVPVLPVLMIFAGHALLWLWRQAATRRFGRLALGLGAAAAFGAWSTAQAPRTGIGANGHVQLARAEAQRGDPAAARRSLRAALAIAPNHVNGLVDLAALERARGRTREARRLYERAARLAPLRTDAIDGLLDLLVTGGAWEEAEARIAGYLALLDRRGVPHPEIPHYHLGRLRAARGQPRAAARAYQEALRRDPRSTRTALALGDLARDAERLDAAAAAYRGAIAALPPTESAGIDPAHRRLVAVLARSGDAEAACRAASAWAARRPASDAASAARARHCGAGSGPAPRGALEER